MDRHEIWRRVDHDVQQCRARAQEGYEPVVRVFLAGSSDPIELGFVETRRRADDTWIRFESVAPEGVDPEGVLPRDMYWTHVPESLIARIEIGYRRIGERPALGFSHREAGEDE